MNAATAIETAIAVAVFVIWRKRVELPIPASPPMAAAKRKAFAGNSLDGFVIAD
jgi:hypothetical protein